MWKILCAIYVRLSKEDEDKRQSESESIQNQKALLVSYAAEHGWDVYRVYCDEDYSGADSLRPDFNRMIAAAREQRFQIVLCKSQSRFTRDMELVEKYLHGLFPIWGIRFIAVADNADTGVKGNKKARQINGLVNEWYLEDLSENVRMVFDLKRREGQYIGGFPIYGYRKHPMDKNKLVVDPEAAGVVRQIFQWSLEGRGMQEIARMLNGLGVANPTRYKAERGWAGSRPAGNGPGLWSKTTVWRILRNEMYTGVMVQGRRRKVSYKSRVLIDVPPDQWYRVEGTHEAVICRETFDAVQQGLTLRSRSDGTGEAHPLSGLVRCMDCGGTMSKSSNGKTAYLRCKLYADSGKEKRCTRHSIRLDRLIELVLRRIRFYIGSYYTLGELDVEPERNSRRAALEQEQKHLAAQAEKRAKALKSLYLDKVSGILSAEQFLDLGESFLEEKRRLEERLARIGGELAGTEDTGRPSDLTERARRLLHPEAIPRDLVVLLVEKIEIGEKYPNAGRQEIKITWRF